MSDPALTNLNTQVDAKLVTAADHGVDLVQAAVDAFLQREFPGYAAMIVPFVSEGAAELKRLFAEYLPRFVLAAEHEIESLGKELAAKARAIVAKFRPVVDPNSPLGKLDNDSLAVLWDALVLHAEDTDLTQVFGGWTLQSIRENANGIRWLMVQHRIVPRA